MDADRIDRVTGWESESFSDGFDGLRALADRDFSGAVTDGAAWLFMLNGRIVGVVDGDLDGFETASGTAYEAPHESLPLLFVMLEQGGRERAQYYTNDTPLANADRKLSGGNFTGYIELSENVLSGDYYVAYYGGNSLSAAFTGSSNDTLKTGEEAFDLANDEIGIYTVHEVDLNVRTVPDSSTATASSTSKAAGRTNDRGRTDVNDADVVPDEADTVDTDANADDATVDADANADDATVDADATADADGNAETGEASNAPGLDGGIAIDNAESEPTSDPSGSPDDTPGPIDPSPSAARSSSTTSEPEAVDDDPDTSGTETGSTDSVSNDTESSESQDRTPVNEESPSTANDTTSGRGPDEADDEPGVGGGTAGTSTTGNSTSGKSKAGRSTDGESTGSSASSSETQAKRSRPSESDDTPSRSVDEEAPQPGDDVFSEEEEWRETKSIPALDPDESADAVGKQQAQSGGDTRKSGSSTSASKGDRSDTARSTGTTTSPSSSSTSNPSSSQSSAGSSSSGKKNSSGATRKEDVTQRESVKRSQLHRRVNRLESALEETEAKRKALVAERDEVTTERDELRETNQRLESRVAELESELEDVRGTLRETRSQLPDGDQELTPAEAREGTNLFVRYGTQGGATLEKAHDDDVGREELIENLQIEHHTSFESDGVIVDGEPYQEFLTNTMEYGFTQWLVEDLLFEIQDTGNVRSLQNLYDAIPEIDRAEIGGAVQIVHQENGEELREQRSFDLVLRNRMGNPLFVADLNASRDPTAKDSLDQLVEDSSLVAESGDEFASAFAVTSSFFQPGALETADDATGGGLLSRSKEKSYVKISRKQGYHLCLAESRDGGFHLTVPEL